jgi:hypothetical protein
MGAYVAMLVGTPNTLCVWEYFGWQAFGAGMDCFINEVVKKEFRKQKEMELPHEKK